MSREKRKILVTSALPYANGPIHIGHLVEYLQTDIWVRFQKLRGHDCIYVCADDAHGTPIMLSAREQGIEPQQLIDRMKEDHQRDFDGFLVAFDNYHSTHSNENQYYATLIYERLRDGGHIVKRTISQAFDEEAGLFLPDRFVRGTCPRCKTEDQYGDNCQSCGATYTPGDLIDPISAISGKPPVKKDSEHYFFKLGDFEAMLREWTGGGGLQQEIRKKLQEWFDAGLLDWDISRDAPYWGFPIPDAPGKYFYVWLDAPIGYMASFRALCERQGLDFDGYWSKDSAVELYHFIGKDIAYFHTLFWPAMLHGAGFRTPSAVFVHGFLTVDGKKMSKSRGTFIMARTFLEHLNPEYLRYYYAAKLTAGVTDIDLSLEDFRLRVNSDLVGKLVNIASRCAGFVNKRFDGKLAATLPEPAVYQEILGVGDEIAAAYESRDFAKAMRKVMSLADKANVYIDNKKPWALVKDDATLPQAHAVCTQGINMFRALVLYLKPVLPRLAADAEAFLQTESMGWDSAAEPLLDHEIAAYTPLMQRVDQKQIAAMVQASVASESETKAPVAAADPIAPEISFDEFSKVDLRVARVISAKSVEGAAKLVELMLDIGSEIRTVFAGIKKAFPDPKVLEGRLVVMVANLAPRKMRFGVSEGMVVAAGDGDQIFLIAPDPGAKPGQRLS